MRASMPAKWTRLMNYYNSKYIDIGVLTSITLLIRTQFLWNNCSLGEKHSEILPPDQKQLNQVSEINTIERERHLIGSFIHSLRDMICRLINLVLFTYMLIQPSLLPHKQYLTQIVNVQKAFVNQNYEDGLLIQQREKNRFVYLGIYYRWTSYSFIYWLECRWLGELVVDSSSVFLLSLLLFWWWW